MSEFCIFELKVAGGTLAIAPLPGRFGAYADDVKDLLGWGPDMVLSMTEPAEMARFASASLGPDLCRAGVIWHALPIRDFGAPGKMVLKAWPAVSAEARGLLAQDGRVLAHCAGGCGRSGMAVLRLMIEAGEKPEAALYRLRMARPCAVETEAQLFWAINC